MWRADLFIDVRQCAIPSLCLASKQNPADGGFFVSCVFGQHHALRYNEAYMTILRKALRAGVDTEAIGIRRIHRWAILFGIIVPSVLLLFAVQMGRSLLALWPTVFTYAYQHALFFGWGGMYAFGLFAYLFPQLVDVKTTEADDRRIRHAVWLYGLGILFVCLHLFAYVLGFSYLASPYVGMAFAVVQSIGWLILQYQIFVWWHRGAVLLTAFEWLLFAGLLVLTASTFMSVATSVWLFFAGQRIVPIVLVDILRVLPITGIGLTTLGFLLRMSPELLGWRPLDQRLMARIIYTMLLAAFLILVVYGLYHYAPNTQAAVLYIFGGFLSFASVVWFLVSMDLFHVRLAPPINHEHVPYVYTSFAWLLLASGMFFVVTVWEVVNRRLLPSEWNEALLYAFFAGFVGTGLLGLYTYWINHARFTHRHRDVIAMVALVLWNWVLALRIFIYPLTISSAWPGAFIFGWILDVLMFVAVALMSVDMYDGLMGHRFLCWKSVCRRG